MIMMMMTAMMLIMIQSKSVNQPSVTLRNVDFRKTGKNSFNPVTAELNPICHLLALVGAHHIFHISGLRVN
jgi:hypothetical protein